jgi:uncharacterized protein YkwD
MAERRLLVLILIVLILLAGCGGPKLLQVQLQEVDTAYLQLLHNKERAQKNLPQLEYDSRLEEYAQKHAKYMAARQRLVHSSLSYSYYGNRGENIAMGQRNEEEVLSDWMHSSGHRANILNGQFTHAGFGCAANESGQFYWCACFGG